MVTLVIEMGCPVWWIIARTGTNPLKNSKIYDIIIIQNEREVINKGEFIKQYRAD